MSLSIKDTEAHRPARKLAQATGRSMTKAVIEALRERLIRLGKARPKADVDELLAIADRAAAHLEHPYRDRASLLYDDAGLPK